jgi:hypothetical protein
MNRTRTAVTGVIVAAVAIGALVVGGQDIMRRARAMMPAATSAAEFESAAVGSRQKLVAQIDSTDTAGMISAHLLARESDTLYRPTPTTLRAQLPADTFFIMGSAADIRKGTVLQLDGTVEPGHVLRAKQLVILNSYVRVAR